MRQKLKQVEQLELHLADQWKGHAADTFHQVTEQLLDDIQTTSDAFERAYSALDTLANQLDSGEPFISTGRTNQFTNSIARMESIRGFGAHGGGIQYQFPLPVDMLEELGYFQFIK